MNITISKHFTEDEIIELVNTLKRYRIKKIHYYDSCTELEFTTFREHYLKTENYENNKILILKDLLYVTDRNDSIVLIKPKKCDLYDSKYDLLIRKFIPQCCDHLDKFRFDNNIQFIEYNVKCYIDKLNFEEIGLIKFKEFMNNFNQDNISEILDNCMVLCELIYKLNNQKLLKQKQSIHYNEVKLYRDKSESLFDIFKLFYSLPNKDVSHLLIDKTPYKLIFESVFLLTTKALGCYRDLQDLQFLSFVKGWR